MEIKQAPVFQEQAPEWIRQIVHSGTRDHVSNPYPALGEVVTIRLEVPAAGQPEQIILRSIPNGEQHLEAMHLVESRNQTNIWEGELLINEPKVPYRFAVQAEGRIWWLNAAGVSTSMPLATFDFKILANNPEISWLSRSVFYQIFPDRFANGDPDNDPEGEIEAYPGYTRKTYPWGQAVQTDRTHIPFYGGDLKGIEDHLDHLQRLGVNAIYLNPIFTAYTNHRYDVADFRNVDPTLGGNDALISLAKALKEAQMRYILDIVPNHSGAGHPWFREAVRDPESPRRSAFFFDKEHKYVSWMGFGSLPKLNYSDPTLRTEMFESDTSVFASWLLPPYSIDGWRVDVGNMLGRYDEQQLDQDVLPAIRKTVKRSNPQSYLMGENFFEAAGQLQGDAWDGVMNYSGFSLPLINWLKGFEVEALRCKPVLKSEKTLSTEALVRSWQENLAAIPWTIALQQFNVLDSHDTTRLRTELNGDDDLIRLAVMIQFTFPGVPCVYYGDEIGLVDEPGFSQRNCFPWEEEKWDKEQFVFYQRLISLRKENGVLAEGSFQVLYWDDDLLVYQRMLGDKRVIVTASRVDQPNGFILKSNLINTKGLEHLKSLFGNATLVLHLGEVKIPAIPRGGAIWL
jgi:alpha-glucosidase